MIAAHPTGAEPSMIAAASPPVRITSATDAGISRRRVSAASTRADVVIGDISGRLRRKKATRR
jgi:hypothetical protein